MSGIAKVSRATLAHGAVGTETALQLPDDLDFESWEDLGRRLLQISDASAWWIGDWAAKGKWRYGDKYSTIITATERAYNDVRDLAYVAGNVPEEIRRVDLPFGHHRAVAKLLPDQQEAWLERAAVEGMSRQELRTAIAAEEATAGQPADLEQPFRGLSVDPDRLRLWQRAAERVDANLNEWAIAVLDAEANR